jgi:hypothetical protein
MLLHIKGKLTMGKLKLYFLLRKVSLLTGPHCQFREVDISVFVVSFNW